MALMEGKTEKPFQELREKFVPTFIRSCMFWLPAQTVNFLLVGPRFRVIYVGACSFTWVNILCWIKRQRSEDLGAENTPIEAVEEAKVKAAAVKVE